MLSVVLRLLGLDKLLGIGIWITSLITLMFLFYGCNKYKHSREIKKLRIEVEKQETKIQEKGKKTVELNEQYLKDQEKKNELNDKLKGEITESVKKRLLQDPKFKKLQEEAKKRHFNELERLIWE